MSAQNDSGKMKAKRKTRSSRAGLSFPVGRIHKFLRRGRYARRIFNGASVYLTAVMEYMASEVLELSGNCAIDSHRKRITPRDVFISVKNDYELDTFLSKVTLPQTGAMPYVNEFLLPKRPKTFNPNLRPELW